MRHLPALLFVCDTTRRACQCQRPTPFAGNVGCGMSGSHDSLLCSSHCMWCVFRRPTLFWGCTHVGMCGAVMTHLTHGSLLALVVLKFGICNRSYAAHSPSCPHPYHLRCLWPAVRPMPDLHNSTRSFARTCKASLLHIYMLQSLSFAYIYGIYALSCAWS